MWVDVMNNQEVFLGTNGCLSKLQLGFPFEQGINFCIFYPHQSSNMVQLVISWLFFKDPYNLGLKFKLTNYSFNVWFSPLGLA
jgi:hypothetical protein